MNKNLKIAAVGMLLLLGSLLPGHAQNLVQPLSVSLTAYDTENNRTVRIGTREMIRYLVGTNVPHGRLYLVTPAGNAVGTTGNLNAFLRITSGRSTTAVFEVFSPDAFNLFQDYVAVRTNGAGFISHALNRFSIESGSVSGELQGFSTWNARRAPVNGVDASGTGSFQSSVNGWMAISDVLPSRSPVRGTISAGRPTTGP